MGIIAINVRTTGLVGETVNPRRCTLITTDSLATITTAGYLNNQNLFGNTILPTDIFDILYLFNSSTQVGVYGIFQVTYSATTGFTLNIWENPGNVLLPVVSGDFAVFNGTAGQIKDSGYLPSDAAKTRVVMAGSAVTSGYIAHFVDTTGTIDDTAAAVTNPGSIYAGLDAVAGVLRSYPATTATGYLGLTGVSNSGAFNTIISNAAMGQSSTISIPDPGTATSKFVLQDGNNTVLSVLNLKYGATPVAQVDPASCTITAAAGASNHCTITIQLKDGSGTNMARVLPFKVYLATDNTGLTLQSAASTGYSVTSGGVKDPTGSTTITQGLAAFSSATGGCVVDLLDTGKGTGNLILMLPNGFKASAAITSGSYGA